MNISEILEPDQPCCALGESLQQAAERMCLWEHDGLPVCDADRRLVGWITPRIICLQACISGKRLGELSVGDTVSEEPVFGRIEDGPDVLLDTMVRQKVWQLPILDEAERLVGTVSYNRLLRTMSGVRGLLVVVQKVDRLDEIGSKYEHIPRWTVVTKQWELLSPAGTSSRLSRGEMRLLLTFAEQPGTVLDREVLMQGIVNRSWEPTDRYVDVVVANLRKKFGERGSASRIIRTVPNEGYAFTLRVADERYPETSDEVEGRVAGSALKLTSIWPALAGS